MQIYLTQTGDTLPALARRFRTEAAALARLNQLSDPQNLTPGLALLIPGSEAAPTQVLEISAGIAPGFPAGLQQELHSALSFACLYGSSLEKEGLSVPPDCRGLSQAARTEGALPLLALSSGGDAALIHRLLTGAETAAAFFESLTPALENSGCQGLYLSLEALYPFDREALAAFLEKLADRLHRQGAFLMMALPPLGQTAREPLLRYGLEPLLHGAPADRVVLLGYGWGDPQSPPQPTAPLDRLRAALDGLPSSLPPEKLLLGLSVYGCRWTVPWQPGNPGRALPHTAAVDLAVACGAQVQLSRAAMASCFRFVDDLGLSQQVWFEDVRSFQARLELVREYGLAGVHIWTANRLCRPLMPLLQSRFSPEKYA